MQSYQRFQHIGRTAFNTSGTNAATFVSRDCGGYTPAFANRIAHSGSHGETGVFRTGVVSLPSDRFARSGNPAWPGGRTANFAPFGSRSRVLPKNAESLRDSDALMRVAVPRRRSPAGLRDLFRFCRNCGLYTLGSPRKIAHKGTHAEIGGVLGGGAIITLDTSCTFTNIPGPGIRAASFAAFGSWSGGALEERREPAEQRCAYARRCSKASRPRWAA